MKKEIIPPSFVVQNWQGGQAKHERYMRLALKLAEKGRGKVFPNPLVGAVLVKNNKIIGQGCHGYFGGPHAEVEAINSARQPVSGADLYVTLEPCNHHGKTPPCAETIIKAGIKRVYAAMKDTNPLVAGKGLKRLQLNHISVFCGIMEKQAKKLNRDYLHYMDTNRPDVILKWAMSADGKIATKTGDARWISNEQTRRFTHRLRADAGAIIVGINTVLKDNPSLTARGIPGAKNPIRIILDHHLRLPDKAKVLDHTAKTIVVCGEQSSLQRARQLMIKGVEVMQVKTLKDLLRKLADRGVAKVLVEGGGEVHASFIEQRLADQVFVVIAPLIIGGRQAITPVSGQGISKIKDATKLHNIKITTIGDNVILEGSFHKKK